jgi:hypothetical protein
MAGLEPADADSPPTAWTGKRHAGKLLTPFFRRMRSEKAAIWRYALPPLMEMVHRPNAFTDLQRIGVQQRLL